MQAATMDSETIRRRATHAFHAVKAELGLAPSLWDQVHTQPPLLVKTLDLDPSYWFTPVIAQATVVAFLRLTLEGDLHAYGYFGEPGIPLTALDVSTAALRMRQLFGQDFAQITLPVLIHDGPPERLTWMATGRRDHQLTYLFWPFTTPYTRSTKTRDPHLL